MSVGTLRMSAGVKTFIVYYKTLYSSVTVPLPGYYVQQKAPFIQRQKNFGNMYRLSSYIPDIIDNGGVSLTICFLGEKYRIIIFSALAVIMLALSGVLAFAASEESRYVCINGEKICIAAGEPQQHKEFARQLGLETADYPEMIQKVRIPEEFDGFYESYNDMQKSSGFDLFPFRGKKCTLYTYRLQDKNFSGEYLLDLMIYRDRIIGGDVSKDKYNGGISGFSDILTYKTE